MPRTKFNKNSCQRIQEIAIRRLVVILVVGMLLSGCQAGNATPGFTLGSGSSGNQVAIPITPAPDLPSALPDVVGQLTKIDGNSLFIWEGGVTGVVNDKAPSTIQQIEIVVPHTAQLFRDISRCCTSQGYIQQKVEAIRLADIPDSAFLMVWGAKSEQRITASIVVVTPATGPAAP